MITRVGPFVLSGSSAGVSVEGPMASVSARVSEAGEAGCAGSVIAVSGFGGVARVVISTGLDGKAS